MNLVEMYSVYRIDPGYVFVKVMLSAQVNENYWCYGLEGKILVASPPLESGVSYLPQNRVPGCTTKPGCSIILSIHPQEEWGYTGVVIPGDTIQTRPLNWNEYLSESTAKA